VAFIVDPFSLERVSAYTDVVALVGAEKNIDEATFATRRSSLALRLA